MTSPKKNKPWLSHFKLLLKLSLVTLLLVFLSKKGFLSISATRAALARWEYMTPAFLAMLLSTGLAILRWQILLRAQNFCLPLRRTAQLTFIGIFFNLALPGAVSGDVVKAYYVGKNFNSNRGRVFGTILLDRLLGLSALVIVSAVALTLSLKSDIEAKLPRALELFVAGAGFGVVIFYGYFFLWRERKDPILSFLKKAENKNKALGSAYRIYDGISHYRKQRGALAKTLAISLVIHVLVMFASVAATRALGEHGVPALGIYVVVPLGLLITAVPLSPAGVGTGHAAFLAFFHFLGSQRGADVFSIYVLFQLIQGMVGGLVYLKFKGAHPIQAKLA